MHSEDFYLLLVRPEPVEGAYERVGLVETHSWMESKNLDHLLSL
jgi:hypothetical protein